jgi:hypothetical protein
MSIYVSNARSVKNLEPSLRIGKFRLQQPSCSKRDSVEVAGPDNGIVGQIVDRSRRSGYSTTSTKVRQRQCSRNAIIVDKDNDNLLAQVKGKGGSCCLTANSTDTGSEKGGDLGLPIYCCPFDAAAFSNDGLVPELVQSATTSKVFDRLEVCNKI